MHHGKARLGILAFGLAAGVLWGLSTLVTGLIAMYQGGWGVEFVTSLSSMYIGYGATLKGSLIGGLWGFVDGFIGGFVLAFLYNCFSGNCCKKCCKCEKDCNCGCHSK